MAEDWSDLQLAQISGLNEYDGMFFLMDMPWLSVIVVLWRRVSLKPESSATTATLC